MLDILSQRLFNQLLSKDLPSANPYSVVKHMTCMQAQDRNQHLWAIASRSSGTLVAEDICHAYNDGLMVRTRTQRGTLHVVAAEDAGWILKTCGVKTLNGFAKRRNFLGISDQIIQDAESLIRNFLMSGPKTRDEISNILKESGIPMQSGWNYHILCYLGTRGIIVQGPIIDGSHAFVLTDQWIKDPKILTEDESLAELTFRYFSSHGPATIADFQWWSGLGIGQIKNGIWLCGDQIEKEGDYYVGGAQTPSPISSGYPPYQGEKARLFSSDLKNNVASLIREVPAGRRVGESYIHFLAGFDEFLLGYKDRTATLEQSHHTLVDVSRNGVFKPTVMIDGKTVGTRSTKIKKDFCEILLKPFEVLCDGDFELLQKASEKYGEYLEKPIRVTMI